MATILLNGVVTDASSISGSDLNDKLTVSGGEDGLSVDLAAGDDAVEIYADSENVTGTEIRVSEGDDTILVLAQDGTDGNNINDADDFAGMPMSLGDSLLGGPGDDVIQIEDGLVQLTGAVKGNEDDDTIHVANINGGTVNGNSGTDTIRIGVFAVEEAGSRAANAVTNGSVMGGQGNDAITVDAAVTDSAIRGNEGDDTITLAGSTFSGATTVNGNAGDDVIDASGAESAFTINGGQGDDVITAGNGQTVKGGLGADTFVVGASGGVLIEDFDKLDLDGVAGVDNDDCFCDDSINIQNIAFETTTWAVTRDKFTSASSWTGDIKVKAVADSQACQPTAVAQLDAFKTETLNAFAVARLLIDNTDLMGKVAAGNVLGTNADYAVSTPAVGLTRKGATFVNGAARAAGQDGIGQAFASAEGFWWKSSLSANSSVRTFKGAINNVVVSTTAKFQKGDFSFLQLTATAKAGCTKSQVLTYDDVTNATVKNHYAEYNKVKNTGNDRNLYTMNFGTANFNQTITGKAYMVLTDLVLTENQIQKKTLPADAVGATAKVTLDLEDYFSAWKQVGLNAGTQKTASGNNSWNPYLYTGAAGRAIGDLPAARYDTDGDGFVDAKFVTYESLQARNLLTLATTVRNTVNATTNGQANILNIEQKLGVNNTARTRDDFLTARGQLVVKIAVSETATAKDTINQGTVVDRITLEDQDLAVTTCPDFPVVGQLATAFVDGQAKQGDVVGTFNTKYLWANNSNNLSSQPVAGGGLPTNAANWLPRLNATTTEGNGFFSGTDFSVDVLEAAGFGDNAVAQASSDAKDVPFRVLFFDNAGTDNGLYIMSGMAGYNNGALTAISTGAGAATLLPSAASSNMGGKHTIVRVSGGKGAAIELSDINFV